MRRNFLQKSLAFVLVTALVVSNITPFSFSVPVHAANDAAPVTADWYKSYQTMDGVGAAYAYTDSIMMMQLATAGHQDTVKHLLDLAFSEKDGTGHDIVRVIIGDNATTATGTQTSPGFNPVTGLLADVNNPGYDVKGNAIPMKGTAGQYGYKMGAFNRIYDGQTDSIWPNEPAHAPGTLIPVKDFIWENSSWNQPIANDDGGPTNLVNATGDPVVIKNTARTRKELFDVDQVWTMNQAMKYGVKQFYACMWEAPYWMSKTSNNTPSKLIRDDVATIDGKNVKIYYQAYADYLVNYIKGMWEQWGIPITQINPFNEIDLASSDANMIKELIDIYIGPSLKAALNPGGTLDGIKNPDGKVINFVPQLTAVDGCNLAGAIRLSGSTFAETDPDNVVNKNKYLDIFSTHLYGTVGIGTDEKVLTHTGDFANSPLDYNTAGTKYPEYLTHDYKLWQTEFMNQDTGDGSAGAYTQRYGNQNINDAVRYANLITNMFCSNPGFNAYLWWSMWDSNGADGSDLIRFVHTNSQQNPSHIGSLTGEYRAFKRLYGFGHFSRFMNPGDVRFDVTRVPAANMNIVGFKSADNKDFSITVTNGNNDDSIQPLEFSLKDFPVGTKSVTVFRTSGSENQKKLATIPVNNGKFVIDIPSASIVTIVPSEGTYATYNGLDGERDIFSSLEAEGNDNNVPGDVTGNAGRANEAVQLGDKKYLAYKNVNFADGSANGGVVRRHLLYLSAQAKSATGGSLLAYVLPVGTAVSSVEDIMSKGTGVAEILVPSNDNYNKYQDMVDTGDLSAYGHKDLYIVAATNGSSDTITIDRFLFGANDSDWSSSANNSTVTIPGNILTNGDFDTTNTSSINTWTAGRYDNGSFVQSVTGPVLTADIIQRYSGYSRYLKNGSTSKDAASAKLASRINEQGKFDGMWQDITGKMTKGERYNFEGYFLSMTSGPLGYDIAAENPGDVEASLVYYDVDGKQLGITPISGRNMPEPYAAREAGERAWWNGNTLNGSILEGGPLSMTSFQPVDVKVADWHESDREPFIYNEPSGTAKVVLALYAKDSNIFYADQLSITTAPDRQGLRDALKVFKGKNLNIVKVVKDALASSDLTQATVLKMITALKNDSYLDMAASLVGMKVDGTPISNFKSDTLNYSVVYPIGGTPNITVDKFDPNANVVITPITATSRQATVTVTYGEMKSVYSINFTVDTSLSSIKISNSTLISFKPDVYNYTVRVPSEITAFPVVQPIAKDPGTKVEVTQAAAIPGVAKVTVSYENGKTEYTINFMNDKTGSDEFNQTELDKTFWYWVNEDAANWSLSNTPGSMSITTHKGDVYASSTNMKNILLQNAPGDWTMETKVTASKRPAVAYQQGGLIAYQDMDNYIKLDWVATSATATNIQVNREVNGVVSSTSINGSVVGNDNTVWLRMSKSGNTYNVYYSTDGTTYNQLGTSYTLNLNNVQAGLSASNGGGTDTSDFKINFDYFKTDAIIGELLSDKANLVDQINTAQAMNQIEYSAETWANLQTALTSAIAVRDNLNAKQSEIDTACNSLKNAMDGLFMICITRDFENQTVQGFTARAVSPVTLTPTNEANHTTGGAYSLKVAGRAQNWEGPIINVKNAIKVGNEYKATVWVKLISPASAQLKLTALVNTATPYYVSLQTQTVSNIGDWVKLEGTYRYLNDPVSIFVESPNSAEASFYIDDFSIQDTGAQTSVPIKDVYKDDFLIGNVAGNSELTPGSAINAFYNYHFDTMTCGNEMKPDALQNKKGTFTFNTSDGMVTKAQAMGLNIHGHVLVWHSQTPAWFNQQVDASGKALKDASGNPIYLSRDEALTNMKTHIKTVMEHFKNQVISWDVVNEAMQDGPSQGSDWKEALRKSPWYYSVGPDFIEQSFLAAREVLDAHPDWNIKLYYNDFNEEYPAKRDAIYNMVKEINDRYAATHPGKLLIEGIGLQSHYDMTTDPKNVEAAIKKYASLGVELSISEVDVLAGMNYSLSDDWAEKQASLYAQLFKIYKENAKSIERVTIWGHTDNTSWRASQNPLPFLSTNTLAPKPAYYAILDPDKYLAEHPVYTPPATKVSTALYGTPTIDGAIDGIWNNAPEIQVNNWMMKKSGASGTAKTLWDDKNLYVLFQVNDTQLSKSSSDKTKQDSVEAYVDEDRVNAWPYREDDGEYRVNYANEQSFKFLSSSTPSTSPGFESAAVTSGTNYMVEMKIPFKTITPQNGTEIKFDAQVNDATGTTLESVATWNDILGRATKSTGVFGNLTLNGKPASITNINDIIASVTEGDSYTLPSKVNAIYSDGTKKDVAVTWNPSSVDTSKPGTYTFKGSVEGYAKEIVLTLTVNAKSVIITNIENVVASVEQGQAYTLPSTVNAIYSDGTKKDVAVTWNPSSVDTSKAGTYTFKGNVEGYDKEITLTLTVSATPVIITGIENVTASVTEGDSYTLPAKVNATYSDGTKKDVAVTWNPSSVDTSKAGTYTFKGNVEGYDKEITLTLTVSAKPVIITSIENVTASVTEGDSYTLPLTVNATYSDGNKKEVAVTWNPSSVVDTSQAGTYTFKGSVEGYDNEVSLTLTVTSKPASTIKLDNNTGDIIGKINDSTTTLLIINAKDNSVISKDIFNALKGKDKTIKIEANNVVWEFNGRDINSTVTADIDFSLVAVSSDLQNKELAKVKAVLGKDVAIAPFSFKYDGSLPGTAKVTLSVGTGFAGKTVAIYRYFADKNTYEYITEAAVDSNGYITIDLDHCSDYFAVEKTDAAKMPKTGSIIDLRVLVTFGLILVTFGLVLINKNRIRRFVRK
jgi:GH35 family endo-1,4-beta-xylanase/regulation of enolase protein 1 (concanavalin A-like superfamily)